jgi:hypothetical protein
MGRKDAMAKSRPSHIPLDFETTVQALLQTPLPPPDVQGSRAAKPKAREGSKRQAARKR